MSRGVRRMPPCFLVSCKCSISRLSLVDVLSVKGNALPKTEQCTYALSTALVVDRTKLPRVNKLYKYTTKKSASSQPSFST